MGPSGFWSRDGFRQGPWEERRRNSGTRTSSSTISDREETFHTRYNDFRFLRRSVSYPTLATARSHFDKDWVIIISTTATALGVVIGVWKGLAEWRSSTKQRKEEENVNSVTFYRSAELPTTRQQIDSEHHDEDEHDWKGQP
jgi:hypothetical protein